MPSGVPVQVRAAVPIADWSSNKKNHTTKISRDRTVEPDMIRIDRNYSFDDDSSSATSNSSSRCDD